MEGKGGKETNTSTWPRIEGGFLFERGAWAVAFDLAHFGFRKAVGLNCEVGGCGLVFDCRLESALMKIGKTRNLRGEIGVGTWTGVNNSMG